MSRRKPYSKLKKENRVLAPHVKGMGDVLFVGFQCLNPECTEFIFVRKDKIKEDFSIPCPKCGYVHHHNGVQVFFSYEMEVNDTVLGLHTEETSDFSISHDDYIAEAEEYKYCIICNTLKPVSMFDRHKARKSGRQGECNLCKKQYNSIKNKTRITDQHREAAQKRRLLIDVAGQSKINSAEIEERFGHKCFHCGKDLSNVASKKEKPLDHTLPVYYLWPLSTRNATLLCKNCNGDKTGSWPTEFYSDEELKRLSVLTGIDYNLLSGPPVYNPDAIEQLHDSDKVDKLLAKYAAYMPEVIKLRNRILKDTGFDFFSVSKEISKTIVEKANEMLG